MQKYFITGTDTDVGKTFITRLLLAKVKQSHLKALAIKPVAAGGLATAEGFINEDVACYAQENSLTLPYKMINPYLLNTALSPNIAAQQDNILLDAKTIAAACTPLYAYPVDYLFVEGAGGWQVPINATQTMADVAGMLNI
ncbi:MAG TPA: dethiobiotin synthase, partial [Gammaproteobacteria bacterium]|nr:dethiobiotin synthase [Gammaproteobacteria bacterium]